MSFLIIVYYMIHGFTVHQNATQSRIQGSWVWQGWISAKGDICTKQFRKGELGLFKGSGLQKEHTIAMLKVVWEIPECFTVDFCIRSWYKRSCNVMRSSVTSFEKDILHHVLLFPFNLVYFERTFYFSDLHRSRSWYYWAKIRHKAALSLV